jgi:Na+-driven multidrug efflux pump
MISSILNLVLQVLFNLLFVYKFNMGTLGCGLSISVSVIFQAIYLYLAVHFDPELHEANFWPTFDREQWEVIKNFLSLGVPQLVMSFIEILGVECMQPLSGLISVNSSSA